MALQKLALLLAMTWLVAAPAASRDLPRLEPKHRTLEARLESGLGAAGGDGGGLVGCWNALLQLRSCTNEIVQFLVNGETRLEAGCCMAIQVITRQCWPVMLSAAGFTVQEADILRGYCDAEGAAAPPVPEADGGAPPPTATLV